MTVISYEGKKYYKYPLQLPRRDINIYIIVSDSISLTFPDTLTLIELSPRRISIDEVVGQVELENITLRLIEDYSIYSDGFFQTLFNLIDKIEMMITYRDGDNERYYIRGNIYSENVFVNDIYIGSKKDSYIELSIVSGLNVMQDYTIAGLWSYCNTNNLPSAIRYTPNDYIDCMSLKELLAATTAYVYNQTYTTSVISIQAKEFNVVGLGFACIHPFHYEAMRGYGVTTPYITFGAGKTIYPYIDELAIPVWYFDDPQNPQMAPSLESHFYRSRFTNVFEFFKHICNSFMIIPHYYFGDASGYIDQTWQNNKHRLMIRYRISPAAEVSEPTNLKSSTKSFSSSRTIQSLKVSGIFANTGNPNDNPLTVWTADTSYIESYTLQPEEYLKFDLELTCDFNTATDSYYYIPFNCLTKTIRYADSQNNQLAYIVRRVAYYNYNTGFLNYTNNFQTTLYELIRSNLMYRRVEITREYGVFDDTVTILSQASINDKIYHAIEVEHDLLNDTTKVVWIEKV